MIRAVLIAFVASVFSAAAILVGLLKLVGLI